MCLFNPVALFVIRYLILCRSREGLVLKNKMVITVGQSNLGKGGFAWIINDNAIAGLGAL